MITITFPDLGVRPHTVTILCEGTTDDRKAADAAIDAAITEAFTSLDARVIQGACDEADPLVDFWRRQVGRLAHVHPLVSSCFADWRGSTLVWQWSKAPEALSRKVNWVPFADKATWDESMKGKVAANGPLIGPAPPGFIRVDGVLRPASSVENS